MRNYFSLLEQIINKKGFFGISNCKDIELFIKGSYVASRVYSNPSNELNQLFRFEGYILNKYKLKSDKGWGDILDFFAKKNEDPFISFSDHLSDFKNAIYYTETGSNLYKKYQVSINDALVGISDFEKLVGRLELVCSLFEISNVNDFDKFFFGYFIYGDHLEEPPLFTPLSDPTFFDLHLPNNRFVKHLVKQYRIKPVHNYVSIIDYMTAPNKRQSIRMFLHHFSEFYMKR